MLAATSTGLSLILFGIAYNWLVGFIGKLNPSHPLTPFLVAFGVSGTLAGAGLVVVSYNLAGWAAMGTVAGAFICSGLPMIAGSVARWLARDSRTTAAMRQTAERALDGN